jgi:P-type Cu+ transporter
MAKQEEQQLMDGGKVIEKCELRIEGMTCGACVEVCPLFSILDSTHRAQAIEGMLRDQKGIESIKVALLAERGVVEYDPSLWTVPKIVEVRHFHCSQRPI